MQEHSDDVVAADEPLAQIMLMGEEVGWWAAGGLGEAKERKGLRVQWYMYTRTSSHTYKQIDIYTNASTCTHQHAHIHIHSNTHTYAYTREYLQ